MLQKSNSSKPFNISLKTYLQIRNMNLVLKCNTYWGFFYMYQSYQNGTTNVQIEKNVSKIKLTYEKEL